MRKTPFSQKMKALHTEQKLALVFSLSPTIGTANIELHKYQPNQQNAQKRHIRFRSNNQFNMKPRDDRLYEVFDTLNDLCTQQQNDYSMDDVILKKVIPNYNDMSKQIAIAMRCKMDQLMYKQYGKLMVRMQDMHIKQRSIQQHLLPEDILFVKKQSVTYDKKPLFLVANKKKTNISSSIPQLLNYQTLNNQILYYSLTPQSDKINRENQTENKQPKYTIFKEGIPFVPWSNDHICQQNIPLAQRKYDKLLFPTIRSLITQQSIIFQRQQAILHKNKLEVLRFFAIQCKIIAIKRIEVGSFTKRRKQFILSQEVDENNNEQSEKQLSFKQMSSSAKIVQNYFQQLQKQEHLSQKERNTELTDQQKQILYSFEQSTMSVLQQISKLEETQVSSELKELETDILVRKITHLKTVNRPVYQRFAKMCELLPNSTAEQRSVIQLRDIFTQSYTLLFKASVLYVLYAITQLKRQYVIINRVDPIQFIIVIINQLIQISNAESKSNQQSIILYIKKDSVTNLVNNLRETLSSLIYHILVINDLNIEKYSNDENSDRYEDYNYMTDDYEHIQFDFLGEKHLSKSFMQKISSKVKYDKKINIIIICSDQQSQQLSTVVQTKQGGETIVKTFQSFTYKEINQFRKEREIQMFDYQFLLDIDSVQEFYGFTFQTHVNIYSENTFNQQVAAINMCNIVKQQDKERLNKLFLNLQNSKSLYKDANNEQTTILHEHQSNQQFYSFSQFIKKSAILSDNIKSIKKKVSSFINKIEYIPNSIIVEQSMSKKSIQLYNIQNESIMLKFNAFINSNLINNLLDFYQKDIKMGEICSIERDIFKQFQANQEYHQIADVTSVCLAKLQQIADQDMQQYNKKRVKLASSFKFSAVQVNTAFLKEKMLQNTTALMNSSKFKNVASFRQINDFISQYSDFKIQHNLEQVQISTCEDKDNSLYIYWIDMLNHRQISAFINQNTSLNQYTYDQIIRKQTYTLSEVKQIKDIMKNGKILQESNTFYYKRCNNNRFTFSNLIQKQKFGLQDLQYHFMLIKKHVLYRYKYNRVWISLFKILEDLLYLQDVCKLEASYIKLLDIRRYQFFIINFNNFPTINYQQISIPFGQKRKQNKISQVTCFFDHRMKYKLTISNRLLTYQHITFTSQLLQFYNKKSIRQMLKIIDEIISSNSIIVIVPDTIMGQKVLTVLQIVYHNIKGAITVISPAQLLLHLERQHYILYNLCKLDINNISQAIENVRNLDQNIYSINDRFIQTEEILEYQNNIQRINNDNVDVLRYLVAINQSQGQNNKITQQALSSNGKHNFPLRAKNIKIFPVEAAIRAQLRNQNIISKEQRKIKVYNLFTWRLALILASESVQYLLSFQPYVQRTQHFLLPRASALQHLRSRQGLVRRTQDNFNWRGGQWSQYISQPSGPSRVQQYRLRIQKGFLDAIYAVQFYPVVLAPQIIARHLYGPCSAAPSWVAVVRRLITVSIRFARPLVAVPLKQSGAWWLRSLIHLLLIPGLFMPPNIELTPEYAVTLNALFGEDEARQKQRQLLGAGSVTAPSGPPLMFSAPRVPVALPTLPQQLPPPTAASLFCDGDWPAGSAATPGITLSTLHQNSSNLINNIFHPHFYSKRSGMGRWEVVALFGYLRSKYVENQEENQLATIVAAWLQGAAASHAPTGPEINVLHHIFRTKIAPNTIVNIPLQQNIVKRNSKGCNREVSFRPSAAPGGF